MVTPWIGMLLGLSRKFNVFLMTGTLYILVPVFINKKELNSRSIKLVVNRLSVVSYILLTFLLSLLASIITWCFAFAFDLLGDESLVNDSPLINSSKGIYALVSVCIIAPLFETFIAQYLPIRFLRKKSSVIFKIIFSAFIFAALHLYSGLYVINTFFIGIVFATGYVLWDRPITLHPFWIIAIVHSMKNSISFILQSI